MRLEDIYPLVTQGGDYRGENSAQGWSHTGAFCTCSLAVCMYACTQLPPQIQPIISPKTHLSKWVLYGLISQFELVTDRLDGWKGDLNPSVTCDMCLNMPINWHGVVKAS